MTKQELLDKIKVLEEELKPLNEQLREIYIQESQDTDEKIKLCNQLKYKFKPEELRFAAYNRCSCGAGYAYPLSVGVQGSWHCSAILLGIAEKGSTHDGTLPFAFYEIKSEDQPSANRATTRPTSV